jgi:pimeloyl-ACP methyl ester carboxylesterase
MREMLIPTPPAPHFVASADGTRIASYEFGTPGDPVVLAVHGFASSALGNWHAAGWTRDLTRSGFRVIAIDQRGHGASDKPEEPTAYSVAALVADVRAVLDAHQIDTAAYLGYSLGSRVGWHAARALPERIHRAILGGLPHGNPLNNFRIDQARRYIADGIRTDDQLTDSYLRMAEGVAGNNLNALVSLVEGTRSGPHPDPADPPAQPILFATGSDDPVIAESQGLAAAAPNGTFLTVTGRHHLNAPTSRQFRDAAVAFLSER